MSAWQPRFWAKVARFDGDACWFWMGAMNRKGYGNFVTGLGGSGQVHRISWEIAFGPIPKGLYVLHRCDNPSCVNPTHLFLGTLAENNRDMSDKGRHVGRRTLTHAQVDEIRQRYAGGELQKTLGTEYGVSQSAISRVVTRKRWERV